MNDLLYGLDIFGTIVFSLSGALMAGRYKLDPFGVVVLSSVTAVGGGTIRDVILQKEIYALAAILGGGLFVIFHLLGWSEKEATIIAILGALLLRLAAIYWRVSLPAFDIMEK